MNATMKGDYVPSGELQGDTKDMPYRGCDTGVLAGHGVDLSCDATQTMGRIEGTGSDALTARPRAEYGRAAGNTPGDAFNGAFGSAKQGE